MKAFAPRLFPGSPRARTRQFTCLNAAKCFREDRMSPQWLGLPCQHHLGREDVSINKLLCPLFVLCPFPSAQGSGCTKQRCLPVGKNYTSGPEATGRAPEEQHQHVGPGNGVSNVDTTPDACHNLILVFSAHSN